LHFVLRALWRLLGREVSLESLMPRCVPLEQRGVPAGEEIKMEFWFDFSSPWAFLGWTQLARLRRVFGNRLRVEMKPFLLGILFREYVCFRFFGGTFANLVVGLELRICLWLLCLRRNASIHSLITRTGRAGGMMLTHTTATWTRTSTSIGLTNSRFAHRQSFELHLPSLGLSMSCVSSIWTPLMPHADLV
jgi:hypothetical protein